MRHAPLAASPLLAALLVLAGGPACSHAPASPSGPVSTAPAAGTATPVPPEVLARLAGTWEFAGGAAERAAVDVAVDQATSGMGLASGFAAAALRPRAQPRERYVIAFEGNAVRIDSPDAPTEAGPLDGTSVRLRDRFSDTSDTTFQVVDGVLVERGTSSDGGGRTVFTPSDDGATLRVHRVLESPRLSGPVDVTYTYRRAR